MKVPTELVRQANPLLAAEQATNHGPTRALFDALRENGWGVKWWEGGTALLVHPRFGTLEVRLDPDNRDRVLAFLDGRQVPFRMAMEHARGEHVNA